MANGWIYERALAPRPGERLNRFRYDVIVEVEDQETGRKKRRKYTFATEREAQRELGRLIAQAEAGAVAGKRAMTVGALLADWLEHAVRPRVTDKTYSNYQSTVERHIRPDLGPIQVQKLTVARVQAYHARLRGEGVGARTRQLCHLHLTQALDYAMTLGVVPRNVARAIPRARWRPGQMKHWTRDEARRFLGIAATGSTFGPLWHLALGTGMRRGELLGVRWQDVRLDAGYLTVRQAVIVVRGHPQVTEPKTATSVRTIYLPPTVRDHLAAHREAQRERRERRERDGSPGGGPSRDTGDFVFATRDGGVINPDNLDYDFAKLIERAGVPRIRIHDLRHTYATLALEQGIPVKVVSENLGHADISTTLRTYAHVIPAQRSELAARMDAALFGGDTDDADGDGATGRHDRAGQGAGGDWHSGDGPDDRHDGDDGDDGMVAARP